MHHRFPNATEAELKRAAALARPLERWFSTNGRAFPWRRWKSRYRLLVTEVLLQRTRAESVAAFAPTFFRKYPGWAALASADPQALAKDLSALGLQSRRAQSLVQLAGWLHHARATEDAPGVGQYIGRAYRVVVDGSPEAMVDANFVRVLRRVFGGPWKADYRFDERLQGLAAAVVLAAADARAVNWAVLDLGAVVCRPRAPHCDACPLAVACEAVQVQSTT